MEAIQKKRNNSTEGHRAMISAGQRNAANNNQQIQSSTFGSNAQTEYNNRQQKTNSSNVYQMMQGNSNDDKSSKAGVAASGEYQSILLTRYLKEPRLPPSSTYYNNNSRKKQSTVSRGQRTLPQNLAQNAFQHQRPSMLDNKPSSSPQKLDNKRYGQSKRRVPQVVGNFGKNTNDISYRNQHQIMRKIFGNEQSYNQVKSLLNRAPGENQIIQKYQQAQQSQTQEVSSPMNQKQKGMMDRRGTNTQNNYSKPFQEDAYEAKSPNIGLDEIILAKSQHKTEALPRETSIIKTERNYVPMNPPLSAPAPEQNNDHVEKAIFDLQDVKNNYFQEKSLFDQKIQQIQQKQNLTMANGFGAMNQTSYNRTATTGFLPTTATSSQRPMTQGGKLLLNQSLMNDNNILKGDLESVSKEDLRERLVVAEMVMKKLFQRNKDLEDSMQMVKERTIDRESDSASRTEVKRNQSYLASPKTFQRKDLNSIEVNDALDQSLLKDSDQCKNCIELRKEATQREQELQNKINDLSQQLLKKTDGIGKQQHLEYLQQRIEETMSEAKRHFANYISVRNMYNTFLESRLNQSTIQGGVKGQKIHNDILSMLKKNLEGAEQALLQERDQLQLSYAKTSAQLQKKDQLLQKKDKKIKSLTEEIERRQFIEGKIQKYVKGLISKNQRYSGFLDQLKGESLSVTDMKRQIDDFQRQILQSASEADEDAGGESTENEEEESIEGGNQGNISVEVNDL